MKKPVSPPKPPYGSSRPIPNLIFRQTLQEALQSGYENPSHFARFFLDLEPYPAQETYLLNAKDCLEANLTGGNRIGKTHLGGLILLWKAFYQHTSPYSRPEKLSKDVQYTAVSTSMRYSQARKAWDYAYRFAMNSPRFKTFVKDVRQSPFPELVLRTRTRKGDPSESLIWARSLDKGGRSLLGESLAFLLVDECAYVSDYLHIEEEVLIMRLADQGGSLFRHSTPNGRNFFYKIYDKALTSGDPKYYSQRMTTWDNPFVPRDFLERRKARLSPELYAQNVMGEFVSASDFFKSEDIERLYNGVDYELPVPPVRGGVYVLGGDLGKENDPTAVGVFRIDVTPWELVEFKSFTGETWKAIRSQIASIYRSYRPVISFFDQTGVGSVVVEDLISENKLANVEGFIFGGTTKLPALSATKDAVQQRKFIFPFNEDTQELVSQLSLYKLSDKYIKQDNVMMLALMVMAARRVLQEDEEPEESNIPSSLQVVGVNNGGKILDNDYDFTGFGGTEFEINLATGLLVPKQNAPYDPFAIFKY